MRRLVGQMLLAAGALIAGASGICFAGLLSLFALAALATAASSAPFDSEATGGFLAIILACGVPMLVGFAMYRGGRVLLRESEQG